MCARAPSHVARASGAPWVRAATRAFRASSRPRLGATMTRGPRWPAVGRRSVAGPRAQGSDGGWRSLRLER
eukprot:3794626-Pyramimonas_sp.AAC.1